MLDEGIRPNTRKAIAEFVGIIHEAQQYSGDLRKVIEMIVDKAGIIEFYRNNPSEDSQSRIENIQEFFAWSTNTARPMKMPMRFSRLRR